MDNVLEVKNLAQKFNVGKRNEFIAVNNISFSLKEGEILGLLGPNGAGKTTTIQMLLGVLTPTSGAINYFGKDFSRFREEILEQVNFSSTYTELPWNFTVSECFEFITYLYDISDRKTRIKKIIDIFRLNNLLDKEMHQLSAGQKTRVNLAKAFLNFPKVLLLDEPTASLDPDVASYIRDFLLEERKKFNVSIILTSHNMAEVDEVCNRVIFINHGEIVADDTPDNLAKTIDVSHISLYVKDGLKRTIEYCHNQQLAYHLEGRDIIIDVREKEIPDFLRKLMDKGVYYDEISIDKPTLEDYFLSVSQQKRR
jgi:ABC-2 type transport system ATP-binding protein